MLEEEKRLLPQIAQACRVDKEDPAVALQKAKNEAQRLEQDKKRNEEREQTLKIQAKFDFGAGMTHVKDVPGYALLYWLLFSIEMSVLAVKLSSGSSYDEAVEKLEQERCARRQPFTGWAGVCGSNG